jgi:hypothetical protein
MTEILYDGPATFTFGDEPTVQADVRLWHEADDTLVTWAGTARNDESGSLWNGAQRMCTIRFGDSVGGYRVGEGMVVDPAPADGGEHVHVRGSGEFAEIEASGR